MFLAFAFLLKDRLSDRFSSQVNYIPSVTLKRNIRKNKGCYINKSSKISKCDRMSNCNNNTINNYITSQTASASIPIDDGDDEYDMHDPYRSGERSDQVSQGIRNIV